MIQELWLDEKTLIFNGVVKRSGEMYRIDDQASSSSGNVQPENSFDQFLKNQPDDVAGITPITDYVLPETEGRIVCGEGSWGGDGFIASVDKYDELRWIFFSSEINPITRIIQADKHEILAQSSLGQILKLVMDKDAYPIFIEKCS